MKFVFSFVVTSFMLIWASTAPFVLAQDDLTSKAQNERELVLYGTALAGQFDKFAEPFKRRYPFLKVQYSRTTAKRSRRRFSARCRRASSVPTLF